MFFPFPLYKFPGYLTGAEGEVFQQGKDSFIGMGDIVNRIMPYILQRKPVKPGFLSAVATKMISITEGCPAIQTVGRLH